MRIYGSLVFILLLCACSNEQETEQKTPVAEVAGVFRALTPEESGVDFKNTITEDDNVNVIRYDYLYNGGGVAVADVNNDGLQDIFFTGNQVSNKLYLNKGDMQFEDVTEAFGLSSSSWSTGATFVDINNDGFKDLYVCASGPDYYKKSRKNALYINQSGKEFMDEAADYGLDYKGHSTAAAFFDYDLDGDLDCYLLTHPDKFQNKLDLTRLQEMLKQGLLESDLLLQNNNGVFQDVSRDAGIFEFGFGLGLAIEDFNQDGLPDIYVSNDYDEGDILWVNKGDGTFENQVTRVFKHTSNYGMGCDAADFNNDLLPDLLTLDMAFPDHERSKRNMASMDEDLFNARVKLGWHYQYMANTLQVNNGNNTFSDIAQVSGVHKTDWSWAGLFTDLDNDGLQDIFITNGFKRDTKDNDLKSEVQKLQQSGEQLSVEKVLGLMPSTVVENYCFQNIDGWRFKKTQKEWGLGAKLNCNGAVYADLDNDGDQDLIVNAMDDFSLVYENTSNQKKHWVGFEFEDSEAIGSRITVYSGDEQRMRYFQPVRGYLGSVGDRLHFGLGETETIDSVWITSSLGKTISVYELEADAYHSVSAMKGRQITRADEDAKFFASFTRESGLIFKHNENEYDDFAKEILLPHKLSEEGPGIAVLDTDGDGYDEVWVGGAAGEPGALFQQNQNGEFFRNAGPFLADKQCEDTGGLAFDANGDGRDDLLVLSGDNGTPQGGRYYEDRLYLASSDGNLVKSEGAFPERERVSSGAAQALDFDQDGDLDLVLGGRNLPQKYPLAPRSYLFENREGRFYDVTQERAPEMARIGMVTDIAVLDLNDDSVNDMLFVGEWMEPTVFLGTSNGTFELADALLLNMHGWWFKANATDLDADGDLDLVLGNLGANNKFQPKADKPLRCFANDFDGDGSLDIVLAKGEDELLPVRGRECSSTQMPFIAEEFDSYRSFAEANLEQIYTKEKLEESTQLIAEDFQSVILWNDGGSWRKQALPVQAQTFPIRSIVGKDVNRDGQMDLILAGNFFGTEVETTRYDAGNGLVLIQDEGEWQPQYFAQTGLSLPQDTRESVWVRLKNGEQIHVTAVNKGYSIVHKWSAAPNQ